MKIGVISDTHIPISSKKLPKEVYEHFKGCDLIIHAGDIIEMSVLKELGTIAETKAVRGNMDSPEVKQVLPEKMIINVGGKQIGVFHGRGPSFKVPILAKTMFSKKLDIIIFGHSHFPYNVVEDGTLYFNPGSAGDTIFSKGRSLGVINIENDNIRAEIIDIL